MAFGIVGIILAASVLCGVLWVVDRLDQRDPSAGRVPWRPWYRTAIGCVYFMAIGFGSNSGRFIGGPVLLELAPLAGIVVLIGLQVATQSRIWLQAIEIFSCCLGFLLGVLLAEGSGFSTGRILVQRGLQDLVFIGGLWFSIVTGIAAFCTVLSRIARRILPASTR